MFFKNTYIYQIRPVYLKIMDSRIFTQLKKELGSHKVTDDLLDRLCASRDVTPINYKWIDLYKMPPYLCDILVKPESVRDIQTILKIARKNKIAVNIYGGGSGTVGGIIPVEKGITIDLSKLDKIISLDKESQTVEVQSGILAQNLEDYLNIKGFSFRHFPQSFRSASIGGLIATKSIGQFSSKYGGIEDFLVGLEAVLPNSKMIITGDKPRSSTGPDINNFFIGSEGIFGIITRATLKIYKIPEVTRFQCFLYNDIFTALDAVKEIMQSGLKPPVVRLYNKKESMLKFSSIGFDYKGCLLILGFDGMAEMVKTEIGLSKKICMSGEAKNIGPELGELWYEHRFDTRHIMESEEKFGGISDAIEISASWSKIKNIYLKIEEYFKKNNIPLASHFSHAYINGISSYNIFYAKEKDEKEALKVFHKTWNKIMDITLNNGGTISHHHGIGMIKSKMLKKELGEGYQLLKLIKKGLDPDNLVNIGKLIDDEAGDETRY